MARKSIYIVLYLFLAAFYVFAAPMAQATVFGSVTGIVHDPDHRPIPNAQVTLNAANSAFTKTAISDSNGSFRFISIPLGNYFVSVSAAGFAPFRIPLTVTSNSSSIVHCELSVASAVQSTYVHAEPQMTNPDSATPTTLISRKAIMRTPGADLTNSLSMITDYVPGAYIAHDMLHVRGGHQISWLIDGVDLPNTNIASNVGPQIDPMDIDNLQVDRGSYQANLGDRTYGVFDVATRSGFEYNHNAELVVSAGSFGQTNDQFSLGNHSEKSAWYLSFNGNRSNYGLMTPAEKPTHDAENGYGGFGSFLYNPSDKNQIRLISQLRTDYFQIPYDPDPDSWQNQLYDSSGLRDGQHETDGFGILSWVHTFNAFSLLQVSPFYHYNKASYEPGAHDIPAATTSDQTGNYAGLQASYSTEFAHNQLSVGVYGYAQHENDLFGATFNNGSAQNFSERSVVLGGVESTYVEDKYKPIPWITLMGGERQTHFSGGISEDAIYPRLGAAVEIPKLGWVFRAFYGHYYQPPPLTSLFGPALAFAHSANTSFVPLHGERDEEHQFGVQIPLHGWLLDADTFETRANNFLDHSNIGESDVFIPVTVEGALIQAWETTLRSPLAWRYGQFHLAYSNQVARQRGPITGGLICFDPSDPESCAVPPGYTPLDHDQRNTLNFGINANLPYQFRGAFNVYYGSGFSNGFTDPPSPFTAAYLPGHTTADISVGRSFGERLSVDVNALNVANTRVLIDNSLTFGGFHYNAPRQIYAEVHYRFHF